MHDLNLLEFFDLLKRGTVVDICAERIEYTTSTEILDSCPSGRGGVVLTLAATIEEGHLELTEAMIAAAEHDGHCWTIRHEGLIFRFGAAESVPGLGPEGFFTAHPEALVEHARSTRERDARREARCSEQEGN